MVWASPKLAFSLLMDSSPADEVERAYQAGLRLLAYQPRSRQEVRQRLSSRFSTHVVLQVLALLEEQGYLNDVAFARAGRESREAHRPRSATLIRRELQQRGVAREVADAAVSGLDEEDSAYQAGRHRLRALQKVDYVTFRRRLGDYLRRRGFPSDVVRRTVERLWQEREAAP